MDRNLIDTAGEVRSGEELDIEAVDAWLKQEIGEELQGTPEVTQYSGGASNWTYRLAYPAKGGSGHDLILRRPPAGTKAKGAHDMGREYRVQLALRKSFRYVPEMIAWCEDESITGSEFYVMRRLEGIIPRKNLPRGVALNESETRTLCTNALDTLIDLHKVDYRKAGLEHIGKGAGYTQRQISGWCERYTNARTWNVPNGRRIMQWLRENIPERERLCITHNDFRFDNLVLDPQNPTQVIGVLDWELATIGNPLMELGNTLAYWVEADDDFLARSVRRQPTHLPGMLTREEVVDYYCDSMKIKPDNWAFYEVYGLFRLSAIGQQLYYRYFHNQTDNPEFRKIWIFVHYLHRRCKQLIKQHRRGI